MVRCLAAGGVPQFVASYCHCEVYERSEGTVAISRCEKGVGHEVWDGIALSASLRSAPSQ